MKMAYTISTRFNHSAARQHNIRNPKYVASKKHIHAGGVYEVWRDLNLTEVYNSVFGDAVAEFNSHARPDRQINSYRAAVRKSAKQHEVYEEVVTIGNKDHLPHNRVGKQIMQEYVAAWEERNPNMIMTGAYYHADEDGAPHVHIDFVPVGTGYKRGMSMRASYSRALENMGYRGHDAAAKWWRAENDVLESICAAHGVEVTHPQRGKDVEHLSTEDYKAARDVMREMTAAALEHSNHEDDILL